MSLRVTIRASRVAGVSSEPFALELPEETSLSAAVTRATAGGSTPSSLIVTHNGRYVPVSQLESVVLADGDTIDLIPLIVGG